MRILVAEDDPRLGPSLKRGLEGGHYAVDLVADGEDAVAGALAVPYDLLILDVQLADGDLAITADYRDVLAEIVATRLKNPHMDAVFPAFKPTPRGVVTA